MWQRLRAVQVNTSPCPAVAADHGDPDAYKKTAPGKQDMRAGQQNMNQTLRCWPTRKTLRYLIRVRRRWIKTIKITTTSTPAIIRISVVLSITLLFLTARCLMRSPVWAKYERRRAPRQRDSGAAVYGLSRACSVTHRAAGLHAITSYLIRVRRRWIKTIKITTTSTPAAIRIIVVLSIPFLLPLLIESLE